MSSNWDFRAILDLHPNADDFECVGVNTADDSKCFNKRPLLSDLDLSKASSVLDLMDQCESLKASFEYLDELAKLCVCVVHSDMGTEHIAKHWKNRVVHHMKKEVSSPTRPKTRRPIWKERGNSQSLMAMVDEVKDQVCTCPRGCYALANILIRVKHRLFNVPILLLKLQSDRLRRETCPLKSVLLYLRWDFKIRVMKTTHQLRSQPRLSKDLLHASKEEIQQMRSLREMMHGHPSNSRLFFPGHAILTR